MNILTRALMMSFFATLIGCGGSDGPKQIVDPGKAALDDLAVAFKQLAGDKLKPPTKMAEMESIDATSPVGSPAIRNGDIIYYWGNGFQEGSSKILAYEKKAETEGGYALLQNGTVKKMTAEEFKSADRAGKK